MFCMREIFEYSLTGIMRLPFESLRRQKFREGPTCIINYSTIAWIPTIGSLIFSDVISTFCREALISQNPGDVTDRSVSERVSKRRGAVWSATNQNCNRVCVVWMIPKFTITIQRRLEEKRHKMIDCFKVEIPNEERCCRHHVEKFAGIFGKFVISFSLALGTNGNCYVYVTRYYEITVSCDTLPVCPGAAARATSISRCQNKIWNIIKPRMWNGRE